MEPPRSVQLHELRKSSVQTVGVMLVFVMQEAVKNTEYWRLRDPNNQAPGLIGWWPEMAVTFIDNHDTGSTQAHWPFPGDKAITGYAYLMTHPGVPCIFWEHYFDWGLKQQLDQMVEVSSSATCGRAANTHAASIMTCMSCHARVLCWLLGHVI